MNQFCDANGGFGVFCALMKRRLATKYSEAGLKEIGEKLGIKESTVSQASLRFAEILERDKELQKLIEKVRKTEVTHVKAGRDGIAPGHAQASRRLALKAGKDQELKKVIDSVEGLLGSVRS